MQLNELCSHSALGTRGTAMSKTKFLPSSGLVSSEAQIKMSKLGIAFHFSLLNAEMLTFSRDSVHVFSSSLYLSLVTTSIYAEKNHTFKSSL